MSIFTGIFSRHAGIKPPGKAISAIRRSVSRSDEDADKLTEFSDECLFMVKADIRAFGGPGLVFEDSLQAFMAGAPIMQADGNDRILNRSEELKIIAEDLARSHVESLRACRGQYCAAVYERSKRTLHLVVDKLGVRPIYCWISADFVVFSTAMRIIEDLQFCTKSISLRGVAEYAAFGYPLSDRTTYENVITLQAGEIVSFSSGAIKRQRYWHWDNLPPPQDEYPDAETRIYETFREGVRLRLCNDRTTTAFLSGGLDSRSIVAMLRTFGTEVLSVSFGPSASQDQAFATLAAERLGARHTQIRTTPLSEGDSFSKATLLPWIQSPAVTNANVERPRLLWSGDGGSVGLGHVYLNEEMVRLTRAGNIPAAAQSYLSHNRFGVHTRLLKPAVAAAMKHAVKQGIEEELNSLHPADAGRTMHLYLMLNDQRRHLAAHFENIDLGRVDFHEPFFDADFLAAILREPIDGFLRHRFYVGWLKKFPSGVLETPWQAYPGHVPCPVPAPSGLSYQWSESNNEESNRSRRTAIAQVQTIMSNKRFSNEYVQKAYLRGVRLLLQAGLRKREYWLHTVAVLHKYWSKADNNQQI